MKKLSYILLIMLVTVAFSGCGDDNSTGPDQGEPPAIPDLTVKAQPDISFFEDNNPQKAAKAELDATTNFLTAKNFVLSWASFFTIGQSYGTFFSEAQTEQATYENGVWVWSYDYNYQGVVAQYRMTAEETAGAVSWAMYWSFDDNQGNSINDYRVVEGTVSSDGSQGNWTFNSLNPDSNQEIPAITSSWNITSDTQKSMTLEFFDSSGSVLTTVNYEANGSSYTMTFNDDGETVVVWNADTNVGSIFEDGTERCWDGSFQDGPCG